MLQLAPKEYNLIKMIGKGAYGEIYLAEKRETNELLTIKVVESDKAWQYVESNRDVLCRIEHENISKIHSIKTINGHHCIVQEYIKGENLEAYVRNNDVSLEDLLCVSRCILAGIEYLSNLGLFHKDIKPSNIIYNREEQIAKLIDLDYAGVSLSEQKYIGSIKYSSPEQLLFSQTSNKSDVYSYGLVMCCMINGNLEFDSELRDFLNKVIENAKTALENTAGLSEYFSSQILTLIEGMLRYEPVARYSSAEALQCVETMWKAFETQGATSVILHERGIDSYAFLDETTCVFSNMITLDQDRKPVLNRVFPNHMSANQSLFGFFDTTSMNGHTNDGVEPFPITNRRYNYRDQLYKEYNNILFQAKVVFWLWIASFLLCFVIVIAALYSILIGHYVEALITVVLDGFIVGIQKLFGMREEYYRQLMAHKMEHLETGDFYDYAFDKIETLNEPTDKDRERLKLLKMIRNNGKAADNEK